MTTQATPQQQLDTAQLTFDGRSATLPMTRGTENEEAIDISALRKETGLITLDPGFANTGACRSAITFIDGERGILRYRGYPIEQLAEKSSFLEVAWLLINGELPTRREFEAFEHDVSRHTMIHENLRAFMDALPKDAHPMPACAASIGALSTFYQQPETEHSIRDAIVRLIAKMPTIAALAYKHSIGQPIIYPRNDLGYSENFLRMTFATPCEEYEIDPAVARVMDQLLILHADHEQNCSTSTVRMVGSSMANLFASISAGISALWGQLHGGANQKVIEMLETIEAEGTLDRFVARAKDPSDPTRLMGFGHRVYKSYDPRAQILKASCDRLLQKLGINSRTLEIAMELEEIALRDEYFIERKLYPNVDFYSGIIYKAIGIPVEAFTVMFAMGRLPGWIAHWLEMRNSSEFRIGRPRQVYIGANERPYRTIEERSA